MFSRQSMRRFSIYIFIAALTLTSCNVGAAPSPTPDLDALKTAIVETTIAQISQQSTQTALAMPVNTNTSVSVEVVASPTLDPGVPSPTLDVSLLPTFSIVSTPVVVNTPVVLITDTLVPGVNTPVVLPTTQPTSASGDACNNNVFLGDITVPDGSVIAPGTNFIKQWALKNTGSCTWDDGYELVYIGGSTPNLDPPNFKFLKSEDFVSPGETINIGVRLTTPCTVGKYEGHWKMRNDKGYYFGTIVSVYVEVRDKCK